MWLQWYVITNVVLLVSCAPLQEESEANHDEYKDNFEVMYLEQPETNSTIQSIQDEPPEETNKPGMFESDIKLVSEQRQALDSLLTDDNSTNTDGGMQKRKVIANLSNRWPQAVVPYNIDPSITDSSGILKAIGHWEYHTCIRFEQMTDELADELGHSDHVLFQKGSGFWSYVGRVGLGPQTISIGDESRVGSIGHEIGHAIGFWHEQGRPDRNDYITVLYENVMPGYEDAFKLYDWEQVYTHNVSYDVGSIMHYGPYYFSKNNLPTIVAKNADDQGKLGNRQSLSKHDIKLANLMYDCPDAEHCKDKTVKCEKWAQAGYCDGKYGGYMIKNCAKSCDRCHECADKKSNCARWADFGFCKGEHEDFMLNYCKRSCGVCIVLDDSGL